MQFFLFLVCRQVYRCLLKSLQRRHQTAGAPVLTLGRENTMLRPQLDALCTGYRRSKGLKDENTSSGFGARVCVTNKLQGLSHDPGFCLILLSLGFYFEGLFPFVLVCLASFWFPLHVDHLTCPDSLCLVGPGVLKSCESLCLGRIVHLWRHVSTPVSHAPSPVFVFLVRFAAGWSSGSFCFFFLILVII